MDKLGEDLAKFLMEYPELIPLYLIGLWFLIIKPLMGGSSVLKLPPPKKTTREMSKLVENDDLIPFIKAYRKANPDLSIEEAKTDFRYLKKKKRNPGR
jgi:hypothetical protein